MNESLDSVVCDTCQTENIVAASSIGLFAIPGCTLYVLMVVVIVCNPQTFANNSYYTLLLSLAVSEIAQLLPCVFYVIPCVLTQRHVFGDGFDSVYAALIGCGCYYAGLATMALIAVNRYFAICISSLYLRVFHRNLTRLYVGIAWLFGMTSGVVQLLPQFGYSFFVEAFTWGFIEDRWGTPYYIWFDRIVWISILALIIFCYVSIMLKVKLTNVNTVVDAIKTRNQKIERKLALQFGIISFIFLLQQVTFAASVLITIDSRYFFLSLPLVCITFLSSNPYVDLIFNSDIRFHFARMFCNRYSDGRVAIFRSLLLCELLPYEFLHLIIYPEVRTPY